MVLFPHERITGPNEVKDRVVVVQPDGGRCRAGGGVAPSGLCGPCLPDERATPDPTRIERPAPAVERSDGGATDPPRDTPPC